MGLEKELLFWTFWREEVWVHVLKVLDAALGLADNLGSTKYLSSWEGVLRWRLQGRVGWEVILQIFCTIIHDNHRSTLIST